jgi:queuine tRNA-ribosyltransferase
MLTDSGGYQAYSMAGINRINEDGVVFKSIIDGSQIALTPERAIQVQNQLGADIIMAFDDCPPSVDPEAGPTNQTRLRLAAMRDAAAPAGSRRLKKTYDHPARLKLANERTIRWLERCKAEHHRLQGDRHRALFGIVQGGTDLAQRDWSAERVCNIELPGYAIGGVAVGEQSADIARVVAHTAVLLPEAKPRYLMGVGYERDLLAAVRAGVDMFDCVLPTRNGRNANAFTSRGQIRLRNAQFAEDQGPLEQGCDCPACAPAGLLGNGWASPSDRPFSRAYIRYLFLAKEMLGPILVSLHNLRHFQRFMADLRRTIQTDDWESLLARWPVASADSGSTETSAAAES